MRRPSKNLRGARMNRVYKGETDRDYIDSSSRVRSLMEALRTHVVSPGGERESARRLPPGVPVSGHATGYSQTTRDSIALRGWRRARWRLRRPSARDRQAPLGYRTFRSPRREGKKSRVERLLQWPARSPPKQTRESDPTGTSARP